MINWIKLNKLIASLIGICTLIGLLYGGSQIGWGIFSSQFASASEFKQVVENIQSLTKNSEQLNKNMEKLEERLDQKIIKDELTRKQDRLWSLQDRYLNKTIPDTIRSEMHELQNDIDQLKASQKQWDSGHR